jgi:hypothetical protein
MKTLDNSMGIKERIQYHTALTFLLTGIVMCFLSFFLNEYDIENGVLFYLGTATTFCGAVFGLDIMIKNQVIKAESHIIDHINDRIDKKMKKVDDLIQDEEPEEEL